MRLKTCFAVLAATILLLSMWPEMALALWKNDLNTNVGVHSFQCSGDGKLEIRFFDTEGIQLNFYKLNADFFVDDVSLRDEYIKEGLTDAGDFLLVSDEVVSIRYDRERFGYFEIIDKPEPGFIFEKFIDTSCYCYADIKLIDGTYHVTPGSIETLGAVFIEDANRVDNAHGLTMTLDGKNIKTEVPPFIENSRTMVPVRVLSEALGAEVTWDSEINTVIVTATDRTRIKLIIGDINMLILKDEDISTIPMDTPAIIKDKRTFVPVRYVAEALGITVKWDEQTQTVSFTK